MEVNEYTIGFITGLVAKPLYVGSLGEEELIGQMIASFSGVTIENVVCQEAVFD